MAKRVQRIGHETATAAVFTGLEREITVDLGKKSVRVHDGLTPGGVIVAKEDLSTSPVATAGSNDGKMTATQAQELTDATAKDASQDIRLDATELEAGTNTSLNASQDIRLGDMDTLNTAQNGRLDTTETDTGINTGNIAILQSGILATILTTGTASAYLATVGISAYVIGTVYKVRIHATNFSSATLALDGLASKPILTSRGFTLFAAEMPINHVAELHYDGFGFVLLNPVQVITDFTISLTSGVGSLSTNGSLRAILNDNICHIVGGITVIAASSPSGTLILSSLPYAISTVSNSFPVEYSALAVAATLGLKGKMVQNTTFISFFDITGLGEVGSAVAQKMAVNTRLDLDFSYPVR